MTSEPRAPIPIVAIAGSVGKSSTALLLDAVLRGVGWSTATWLDDGVRIDGQSQVGELEPWGRAVQGLLRGEVRLAIQELPSETVQAVGLPVGAYTAAIITNLSMNEPLMLATEHAQRQAAANRRVAAAVHAHGTLLLNADDRDVADLAVEGPARVVFWALRRASPPLARHLKAGHAGLYLAGGDIVWEIAEQRTVVASVASIPVTLGGRAIVQVQNVLPALAAALVLGVPAVKAAAILMRLPELPSFLERTLASRHGVATRAVVAEARGLLAFRSLARLMARLDRGSSRVVGAVAWPDGLDLVEAREIARTLARLYDLVFVHGRDAAAAATLVVEARPTDRPPTFCRAVASEADGLMRLARLLTPRDRMLLVGRQAAATLALFESFGPYVA